MIDQQKIHRMHKELIIFRTYVIFLTSLLAVFWFAGFTRQSDKQHFTEIDVERLNIVEANGKYRMVISNRSLAPDPVMDGITSKRQGNFSSPGIIFYNDEGDESGALVSVGRKKENGEYSASSRLVFDRFKQDETIALQYYEDQLGGYANLVVNDRPDIPLSQQIQQIESIRRMPDGPEKDEAWKKMDEAGGRGANRVLVGKDRAKSAAVKLADRKGNTRLRLIVDTLGVAKIDFLDEKGTITFSLPDSLHSKSRQ